MKEMIEQRYLFLGVGGMGMAPLASWMSQAGYLISGYDASLQESVRRHLQASGVHLYDLLLAEELDGFDQIVYSSALRNEHPLIRAARARGLNCIRRGEMLARIARGKKLIAVAGSHGKTTTTGMIAYAMRRLSMDVNYILGGLFTDPLLPPAQLSNSPWLIAEIDESDGTIEQIDPELTLILNLDWDHADHYREPAQLEATFRDLVARTRETVFLPVGLKIDVPDTAKLVFYDSHGEGDFNQANARAANALLGYFNADVPDHVLSGFPGIARRQGLLLDTADLTIIEDYAHHPTEIAALIQTLKQRASVRRLVVVFQPHRYTRTLHFKKGFAETLAAADVCFLLPVYGAHEAVVEGGTIQDLVEAFSGQERPVVLDAGLPGVRRILSFVAAEPTLLAFIGAGDIEDFSAAVVSLFLHPEGRVAGACRHFLERRLSKETLVKENEPLANKTTMRIGGPARLYAEPASFADLRQLLKAAKLFDLKYFCLGRGSNLLVPDEGFDGLVIRFSAPVWRSMRDLGEGRIWVGAGCRLKELCGQAAKSGLSGFEFLEGIPGAVGGALCMNAGAMGSWMFDVVERVQFIDATGVYQDWPKESFNFGYRKVEEISRGIALGAILRSREPEEEKSIRCRIDSYASVRKESQPRGSSAGCIFKNPEGSYAGKLIDEHGLKGLRVGAAEVSAVHGNFIVNQGGATARDVIELVRQIRARVHAASGYELEPEVLLVGREWSDVLNPEADV